MDHAELFEREGIWLCQIEGIHSLYFLCNILGEDLMLLRIKFQACIRNGKDFGLC